MILAEGASGAEIADAAADDFALVNVVLLNNLATHQAIEDKPHGADAGESAHGAVASVDLPSADGGPLTAHLAPRAADRIAAAGLVVEAGAKASFPGRGHS